MNLFSKIFGTKDSREIKKLSLLVKQINDLEKKFEEFSDEEIKNNTLIYKNRFINGESLDSLLPEAFANVREASKRTLGLRHFDVQLIGGIVLHQGRIAEMKTGEGKTLVATLSVYLNALKDSVHVVTVNDYLAKRDRDWMGQVYEFLGLTTSVLFTGMSNEERSLAYSASVVFGTNNEFGFDYLRDNMASSREHMVQKGHHYAVVDEIDSILIDEARTPLIISGSARDTLKIYQLFAGIVKKLIVDKHYIVDEKEHNVLLNEDGILAAEKLLKIDNLYSAENVALTHYLNQSLKAKELYKIDRDYIVKEGKVIIVDEFTGRLMPGRRYSEGLHQSIEAKEGVRVAEENQTLATITIQNYFRMYSKLSGMTGTAKTEESEFIHIYELDVISIPTNKQVARIDHPDIVFISGDAKLQAIINKIEKLYEKGQPVLVGTASINNSEILSGFLKKKRIPHNVLNAKFHKQEAEIIAQAGRYKAVTIATNMAGRGTDIILGGNPEALASMEYPVGSEKYHISLEKYITQCAEAREKVLELGGLFVLGTERHESRRIDNQLRGRSGRQGDPGESLFYISLADDLMRLFGSDRMAQIMIRMGYDPNAPMQQPMVSTSIKNAQKRVEARNFGVRKQLLEYDDVVNKQREVIYKQRMELIDCQNIDSKIESIIDMFIKNIESSPEKERYYREKFNISSNIKEFLMDKIGPLPKVVKQQTMLRVIDARWRDNIADLESLREGIHLRSYGQRDPIVEYKLAAAQMYKDFANNTREEIIYFLLKMVK